MSVVCSFWMDWSCAAFLCCSWRYLVVRWSVCDCSLCRSLLAPLTWDDSFERVFSHAMYRDLWSRDMSRYFSMRAFELFREAWSCLFVFTVFFSCSSRFSDFTLRSSILWSAAFCFPRASFFQLSSFCSWLRSWNTFSAMIRSCSADFLSSFSPSVLVFFNNSLSVWSALFSSLILVMASCARWYSTMMLRSSVSCSSRSPLSCSFSLFTTIRSAAMP
mmetsp:Transcript_18516/g.37413  ORF Transcript_18516/g.37413 Transcript_18516/m.37413 type:complete len:218 (+) Transcript_18516:2336-2989(+)